MVSIREVAILAGVSPATVSRVINGTARVDEDKKERVLQAIEATGFVPNEVARSLFKKSAKIIGFIVPNVANPFFIQLAEIIEKTADASGYRLILCNTGNEFEKEKSALQMLTSMNADGIILTTNNAKTHEYIEKCNIPVIVIDRRLEKDTAAAYVHCDHYKGGRMAAEYLIECGCKNIVCIKGPQELSSARERYEGYRDVCAEQGVRKSEVESGYDFQSGLHIAEVLLQKYPDVDGIIACNDIVAISVYKILYKRGIKVPEQIQIIGFDNINLSELITPGLTTIAQPIEEIGKKVAELIIHKNINENKKEYIFDGELIIRETTRKGV